MRNGSAAFLHQQMQFTANIREPLRYPIPPEVDPKRMQLYQDLCFENLHRILSRAFPILSKALGTRPWERLCRDFFAKHKSKRPTQHEIPEEFLHYLSYVRRESEDPPWTYELAHYEWVEHSLTLSPLSLAEVPHDFEGHLLNEIPVVSPLAWLHMYQYPVHTITAEAQPMIKNRPPTFILVYRNWADEVQYMVINEFTHALIRLLKRPTASLTGREAIDALVKLSQATNPATLIQGGSLLLEDLRERHIILGTKSEIN
jgi:hypothetical protein